MKTSIARLGYSLSFFKSANRQFRRNPITAAKIKSGIAAPANPTSCFGAAATIAVEITANVKRIANSIFPGSRCFIDMSRVAKNLGLITIDLRRFVTYAAEITKVFLS